MSEAETSSRVHRQLATMVALEQVIGGRVEQFLDTNIRLSDVVALLKGARESTQNRLQAVTDRLKTIAPDVPLPDTGSTSAPLETLYDAASYPASVALLGMHALFNQAAIGYAVLMQLSFRAGDSAEVLGPVNTGDLAWEHMRAHSALAQEVARLLPYAVVEELEREGLECQCPCPACGLGICVCAPAFRRRFSMAWDDAGPIETWPGLRVVRPRSGSPAREAGIQKDDVLVAIGGKDIESLPMLQQAIASHEPGEEILVEALMRSGERRETRVVRR